MKKILTVVLALVLVCGLAVTAMAAGFGVETDKDIIEAGEEVTVTVTLDETITADQGATSLGGKLTYDESAVTLVAGSAKASDAYSFVTVTESKKAPEVKIAWFSVTSSATELPAGTIMTVSFTANKELSAATVEAIFGLDLEAQTALGETVVLSETSASVKVCVGHSWEETGRTVTCTEAGEISYSCVNCGATKTEAAEATGHVASEWPDTVYEPADNWPPEKIVSTYYCQYCNEEVSSEVVWVLSSSVLPKTVEVAPGETIVFQTWQLGGLKLGISGSDFTADLETSDWYGNSSVETYTPVDGVAVISIPQDMMIPVYVKLTNTGSETATYDLELIVPVGHYLNPVELQFGENSAVLEEGNYMGYYFSFDPTCVGTLTVTASGDYWHIAATNYGPSVDDWSDDWSSNFHGYNNEFGDTITIDVKPGDIIEIWVWAEDDDWNNPASTITVNATVDYNHEGHLVHVEGVEPGCHFQGLMEHWYCKNCETVWTDAELTQVSNHNNVVIPELGGDVIHVEAKAPTCYEDGNIEHWYCETCEQVWQDEARTQLTNHKNVKIGATGHQNIIHMEAVAPGCHFEGHVEHWYCADCNTVWTDAEMTMISNHKNVVLPELGGDVIHVEAKDPTCTENGNIEYWYCEHCEQVWQDEARTQLTNHKNVIVGATGHVYGEDGVCTICGENPKSGDAISVVVAVAFVSAMSIVALPLVKKHF